MSNIEPAVIVKDVEKMAQTLYGNAGKIALIGAFPTNSVNVEVYTNLSAAQEDLKGEYRLEEDNSVGNSSLEVVPEDYTSFYCLPYIFENNDYSKGPESVLVVNVNYGLETLVSSVTTASVANACVLLSDEDFDILTIADNVKLATLNNNEVLLNPIWNTLKSFSDSQFNSQKPFGIITGVEIDNNASVSIIQEFKSLFKDKGIYKAVCTPIRLNGAENSLNIAESGCWHSAFTSGRPVNKSETSKLYPNIIGEDSKTVYPLTEPITWKNLLDNGFLTCKYRVRRLSSIQCLSNITPADYDMKIERVKNYMIKRLALRDVLGDDNVKPTRAYVEGLIENEKKTAITSGLLTSMEYNLVSIDTETVKANVKLGIPDIIRTFELDITLEITAYTEED